MTDPFAPPAEGAPSRRHDLPRDTTPRPYAPMGATGTVYEPPAATRVEEERDARWRRHHEREDRWRHERDMPQPARPGLFWVVAGIGVGLLLLARLVLYFSVVDELDDDLDAPALFGVLGVVALSAGLALAGLLQRGLAIPWRIALVVAAGFFAVVGGWPTDGFDLF